jgi:hypothetical protein
LKQARAPNESEEPFKVIKDPFLKILPSLN